MTASPRLAPWATVCRPFRGLKAAAEVEILLGDDPALRGGACPPLVQSQSFIVGRVRGPAHSLDVFSFDPLEPGGPMMRFSRSWTFRPFFVAAAVMAGVWCSAVSASGEELLRFRTLRLSEEFYGEGAAAGDFDRDGEGDVVSGPYWYRGPEFKERSAYYPPKAFDPLGYSDNFFAFTDDFNRDKFDDIVIVGFPGKEAFWFENPGDLTARRAGQGGENDEARRASKDGEKDENGFWTRHVVIPVVDNESPQYVNLVGDGRPELVCSSGGYFGYAAPDRENPEAEWAFHRISDQTAGGRFTHGLGVGDVNGDGRIDLLEKTGWWEQPESLEGDPVWKKHAFEFSGPGGAQMYAYDFDGDGDNDVLTSLAAHAYGLAWYEHVKADDGGITFRRRDIMGAKPEENRYGLVFSQLHAIDLADMDGDGLKDIVTGKRWWAHGPKGDAEPNAPAVLYWFRTLRNKADDGTTNVDFVPHKIDDDSGVGVEVKAVDVNGDELLDVVVGNKKGTFVHLQSREGVSAIEWRRAQPLALADLAQPTAEGLARDSGLEPEDAARAMTVPKGFRVQLAAGEPLVHQPVAFTIDERGRLWVAEAHTYPQRAKEGEGRDKIIILEDADGDGRFESRKVFCEGLNLVSGLEVGFGGVWVGAAPYLMFIPDRDRDDVPDGVEGRKKRSEVGGQRSENGGQTAGVAFPKDVPAGATVLLDGFGWHDTHETLNSFIWGPDGWLYGCHGVFTHSNVGQPGTPDAERTPLNAGVWRYHPVQHEFEVFAHGTSNPWGVDFNEHGQAFATACVIPHLYHVIQGGRYQRQAGQHFNPYTYQDIETIADHAHYAGDIRDHAWWGRNEPATHATTDKAGGGHAHAGAMIYLGNNWPEQYRGTLFMANIHGNRLNNDILERAGSGYVGRHGADFLFANDRWFRGINLKTGPDGGAFVIDWYDKNACHRNTPEIWDRTNGRIYKVTYGEPEPGPGDLAALSDAELVSLQLHDNEWHVRTARRILQARAAEGKLGDEAQRALLDLLRSERNQTHKLRVYWTLHAIGGLEVSRAAGLLAREARAGKHEYVRGWLIQSMLQNGEIPAGVFHLLADLTRDSSPVVRLYLAAALQRLPLERRWTIAEGLLAHAEDADDHNLPLMIWYGVEPLVMHDTDRALELARGAKIPLVGRFIIRRAASDPAGLDAVLTFLRSVADDEARLLAVLDEIVDVVKDRGRLTMPRAWPSIYKGLAASSSDEIRRRAQFITVKFGDRSIFPALRSIVADATAADAERKQVLEALLAGSDPELPPVLFKLLKAPQLRGEALRGLARFDHPETARHILEQYGELSADERGDAVATLATRPGWAKALLEAIGTGDVPRSDLPAYQVEQMRRFDDASIAAKLNEVWGQIRSTPAEKKALIDEWKERLTPETLAAADLSAGRLLYTENCGKCHRLFGDGGTIGPDITGSNRAQLDYVLQNIIDPSAVVGRDYQMTVVATVDGRVMSGLVVEENDSAVVIQTVNDRVVVPVEDIDERSKSAASIMPEGQLKQMTPAQVRDLVAYLGSPSQVPLPGAGPEIDDSTGRVAGAVEGESLKVVQKTAGDAGGQNMAPFKKGRWSGVDHLWWRGAKPGAKLSVEVPVEAAGRYELLAVMTKARDYGIVQLALDGEKLGKPIDLYNSPDVITTGPVSLGTHDLSAGTHRLTIEITGKHAQAVPGYMFGLDYLYLVQAAKSVTAEK
ncbi:MAG: c-type cytochrome [Planctomycetes bacterium]|nr:c-type cytochrome [Planctomycetota bacterium]